MNRKEDVELMAQIIHEVWTSWMEYVFSVSSPLLPDGGVAIPDWAVNRWKRQMNTDYEDLPETEKQSDQEVAERILKAYREKGHYEYPSPGTGLLD